MDTLNLASDESIVKKAPRIIVSGIRCEASFTSKRIIIVERENKKIFLDIPYSDIDHVVTSVNGIHEPVLSITHGSPDDGQQSELFFVYQAGGQNIHDLEKCITVLKEYGVPVENTGLADAKIPRNRVTTVSPSSRAGETESQARNPSTERTISGMPWQPRQPPLEEEQAKSNLPSIIALVLVVALLIGLLSFAGHVPEPAKPKVPVTPTPTVPATPEITPVPEVTTEPVPTPAAAAAPASNTTAKITSLPHEGIWAEISYPGSYYGYIGGDGRRIVVNDSGTLYVPLPFQNTTIDGSIEKRDGSPNQLQVAIYNGGSLVAKSETKKPLGIAEIHTPVGLAMGYSVVTTPTPAPVVVIPTPEPSLTLLPAPSNGVWVRVAYPGTFAGSIVANGDRQEISGSGDKFFPLSMKDGIVEGSIDKSDTSTKNMIVEVYKDGSRVLIRNTSQPRGKVELYTAV